MTLTLSTDERPDASASFLDACRARLGIVLQPLYALRTGRLIGFEALTRGFETLSFTSANELFDHAASIDNLAALEMLQIERAIGAFGAWRGEEKPVLFAHLDTRLLTAPTELLRKISSILESCGVGRERLCFQLSERHQKTQSRAIERAIGGIRGAGFQLAIDDFGAGVSDVKTLCKFDVDYLKIDQFFITDISKDHRKRLFVSSMIELAHKLGQKVVAEGVETEDDLLACRDLGCDIAQGFALAEPHQDPAKAEMSALIAPATDTRSMAPAAQRLRQELEPLPAFHIDAPMNDVLNAFQDADAPHFFVVVGDHFEPLGLVRESSLRSLYFSRVGLDLARNSRSGMHLRQYLSSSPTVDISANVAQLAQNFIHDEAEGVIVTDAMRYVGFLRSAKLLQLSSADRLRRAQDENPLTGLPGNRIITDFITRATQEATRERLVCYLDFDHFKAFNDRYGFALGDRAILMMARLLKQTFAGDDFQLGHIGGDDFFLGAVDVPFDGFLEALHRLLEAFRHEAESLYSAADRQAGGIFSKDRDGAERLFPLLRCSAGLLQLTPGASLDISEFSSEIAALKKRAKESRDGIATLTLNASEAAKSAAAAHYLASGRYRKWPTIR